MAPRKAARGRRKREPLAILVHGASLEDAERLARRLELGGATAWRTTSFRQATELAAQGPDLVAVAWDGASAADLKLVRRLQQERSPLPVLVALSHPTAEAWMHALDAGADACVTSYQHEGEIAAQCAALVRRAKQPQEPAPIGSGPIRVEPLVPVAVIRGEQVPLTSAEHFVLSQLAKRLGETVKREALEPYPGRFTKSALESLVSRLRTKLDGLELRSVRSEGYVLRPARRPRTS